MPDHKTVSNTDYIKHIKLEDQEITFKALYVYQQLRNGSIALFHIPYLSLAKENVYFNIILPVNPVSTCLILIHSPRLEIANVVVAMHLDVPVTNFVISTNMTKDSWIHEHMWPLSSQDMQRPVFILCTHAIWCSCNNCWSWYHSFHHAWSVLYFSPTGKWEYFLYG